MTGPDARTRPSDLAVAISVAEGFNLADSVPRRAHNPGDLVCPWLTGETLGAEGIHVFPNDDAGWDALEHQLDLIRAGASEVYDKDMTIQEMANHWTRTEPQAWATNVAQWFYRRGRQVTVRTLLSEVL